MKKTYKYPFLKAHGVWYHNLLTFNTPTKNKLFMSIKKHNWTKDEIIDKAGGDPNGAGFAHPIPI